MSPEIGTGDVIIGILAVVGVVVLIILFIVLVRNVLKE